MKPPLNPAGSRSYTTNHDYKQIVANQFNLRVKLLFPSNWIPKLLHSANEPPARKGGVMVENVDQSANAFCEQSPFIRLLPLGSECVLNLDT